MHEWYKFDDIVNDGHDEETSLRHLQTRHLEDHLALMAWTLYSPILKKVGRRG